MSTRVYYIDMKKKKLRQDALAQLRETQSSIDPVLLARLHESVGGVQTEATPAGKEPVDRKKTFETILKFLHLTAGRKGLQAAVQEMISETRH